VIKEMKKLQITAALLAAMTLLLMTGIAAAALTPAQGLQIYGGGTTWKFAPDPTHGTLVSVQPYYYLGTNVKYELEPVQTNINNNIVVLTFDSALIHELAGDVSTTGVHVMYDLGGVLTTDPYGAVSGPGFAWGRIR
jgi:hypothetical protein